jgi:hypothetical protein
METLAGTWLLSAWSAVWAYEFDRSADEFLYQDPITTLPRTDDAGEVRGSTLSIRADGGFSQEGRGDRPILTYDEEGVQVAGVAEFGGEVREDGGRGFLLPHATPSGVEPVRLRWDDGDSRICDSARVIDGRLVRTICVMTDECYGDRVVLAYDRS